jgi:hypothetical protein
MVGARRAKRKTASRGRYSCGEGVIEEFTYPLRVIRELIEADERRIRLITIHLNVVKNSLLNIEGEYSMSAIR